MPEEVGERPKLSLRERDRRWASVRALLRGQGLSGLIVGAFRSREAYDSYLTNDHLDGIVIFPLDGEPTVVTWNTTHLSRANTSEMRGEDNWVADRRPGFGGAKTAEVLCEKDLASERIGVVGLSATSAGEREGTLPHTTWERLVHALPQATLVDITEPYADLVMVKSNEEIALVRYAADVSEAACQTMLNACRPGIPENEIYAAVMSDIFRHGCDARYPMMSLHSGPMNTAWGRPRWIVRAEKPRRLEPGDMVQAEIHTCYGGQEAQVQMSVGLGPVDEINRTCADVARRSYDAGLAAIRPGMAFRELVHAMAKPLETVGCWTKAPLVHTMNYGAAGGAGINIDRIGDAQEMEIESSAAPGVRRPDMPLVPGTLLELEPNAGIGTHRVVIGGAVLVTENGCEEFNSLPTRTHFKP